MPKKSKMWWEQGYITIWDVVGIIIASTLFWGAVIGIPFLIMMWITCGVVNCP